MGLFDIFKKSKGNKKIKPSLSEDIVKGYEWIAKALISSGYKADFSIESLKEMDRFFDENTIDGKALAKGLLSQDMGNRIFAIGAYIGEVIRRKCGGEWNTDDNDPKGEINISIKLEDGTVFWPVRRAMKRFKNGQADSIYAYGMFCVEQFNSFTT